MIRVFFLLLLAVTSLTLFNSLAFAEKADDNRWETIARLHVSNQNPNNNRLNFRVDRDKTRIYLHIKNLDNKRISNLVTSQPDIYGRNEWPVNIRWGSKAHGTYFNAGSYVLWADFPPQTVTRYSYDLEVRVLVKD